MRKCFAFLLLITSPALLGQGFIPVPNFFSDGFAFVPPSCVDFPPVPQPGTTVLQRTVEAPEINLPAVHTIPVRVRFWRVACPDGKTIITMSLENLSGLTNVIPAVSNIVVTNNAGSASFGAFTYVPTEFTNTGNGFPSALIGNWWFAIGNVTPPLILTRNTFADFIPGSMLSQPITFDDLQGEITITVEGLAGFFESFVIPPANQMTPVSNGLPPITGRHAGTWVVENTSNQGILLSISELPDGSLVAFMAWFTFDANGNQIWFTGNSFFQFGDNSVSFNLNTSINGSFNQLGQPQRITAGTATLSVNDCSELVLAFNLTSQSLGSNTVILRRLFAGETAGYTCRDLNSRIQELSE